MQLIFVCVVFVRTFAEFFQFVLTSKLLLKVFFKVCLQWTQDLLQSVMLFKIKSLTKGDTL